jgi:hypothetical protein
LCPNGITPSGMGQVYVSRRVRVGFICFDFYNLIPFLFVYILTWGSSWGVDHIHINSRKSSPRSMRGYEVIVIILTLGSVSQTASEVV